MEAYRDCEIAQGHRPVVRAELALKSWFLDPYYPAITPNQLKTKHCFTESSFQGTFYYIKVKRNKSYTQGQCMFYTETTPNLFFFNLHKDISIFCKRNL